MHNQSNRNLWHNCKRNNKRKQKTTPPNCEQKDLALYLSSTNSGADICDKLELEFCDLGRGMWGVNGLYDVVATAGTGVSHILTVSV